jgi:hypothetical protein
MSVMITVSVRPEHDWSFLHLICATHTARKNVSFIFNLQPASKRECFDWASINQLINALQLLQRH